MDTPSPQVVKCVSHDLGGSSPGNRRGRGCRISRRTFLPVWTPMPRFRAWPCSILSQLIWRTASGAYSSFSDGPHGPEWAGRGKTPFFGKGNGVGRKLKFIVLIPAFVYHLGIRIPGCHALKIMALSYSSGVC